MNPALDHLNQVPEKIPGESKTIVMFSILNSSDIGKPEFAFFLAIWLL